MADGPRLFVGEETQGSQGGRPLGYHPPRLLAFLWSKRKSLPWLLAAAIVVRGAGLPGLVNVDECDFSLFGRLVRHGEIPYVGVVDNKPPLTYLVFGLADLLGGAHWILAIRIVGVAAVFFTSLALFAAARAWTGDERHGWAAAWLGLAAGLCESPSVSAELLMNLPTAVALYLLALAGREGRLRLVATSGAAAAVATLFKQQAAALVVAVAVVLVAEGVSPRGITRRRAWGRLLAFSAGFAVPWLVVAGVFAHLGALSALYEWLVLRNFAQVSTGSTFSFTRALAAFGTCVVGATPLPWLLAVMGARRIRDAFHVVLVVLLGLTLVSVSVGGRFYEHYFLQFVPPLALLGARPLVELRDRWTHLRPALRSSVLALAIAPVVGYLVYTVGRGCARKYPLQDQNTNVVASWLVQNTTETERVFVWGDQSVIYCGSGRLPGTRYMRTAFHVGDVDPAHVATTHFSWRPSSRDVANTLADLEARRPEIVIDTSTSDIHHWDLFPLRAIPELDRYVQAHYRLTATAAGVAIYRRL
jgi:MFS family permease